MVDCEKFHYPCSRGCNILPNVKYHTLKIEFGFQVYMVYLYSFSISRNIKAWLYNASYILWILGVTAHDLRKFYKAVQVQEPFK